MLKRQELALQAFGESLDEHFAELDERIAAPVVDPKPMATTDILRDIKPGNRIRLLLVGGESLVGDFEGYTDELDHTFAWLATRECKATVRVAHIAAVVEVTS